MLDTATVRKMLADRLLLVPNLPTLVAWQNRTFQPPDAKDGNAYIRETFAVISEQLQAFEQVTTIGRVNYDIFVPAGSGTDLIETYTQAIAGSFKPATTLRTILGQDTGCPVQIYNTQRIPARPDRETDVWYVGGVLINWRAFAENPFTP